MTLRPQSLPPVPAATAAVVRAAFPNGTLYVDLRDEFGLLYDDQLFVDLYPAQGRPVSVAPWRLALVLIMQYIEGLTDRQAADAVRRCVDWKYALSLELTDPGFYFTLLHDFRERLLASGQALQLLDTLLAACKARGWIKPRGQQRTDSTHVLAAVRTLGRLENVLETLHLALNHCAAADPDWVQAHVPAEWYRRYGTRAESGRLPKEASKREALAAMVGADGFQLLAWALAADTPATIRTREACEILRQIGLQQY
jgi:transposase